ncbi:MAG TPA: hypothetical protein VKJ45_18105 [Blastocatellia bacterium]|nr:hypothetical protein [Blastocatellia bacterium]
MGLEFSFDDISLDQQVSREQLEIDLYDELIEISDAEPDEQIRMLSSKPAAVSSQEDDKPESIRVTASLGKERVVAEIPATSASDEQASKPAAPVTHPPLPASPRKSAPLPYPPGADLSLAADPGNTPLPSAYRPAADSSIVAAAPPPNGQRPAPVHPAPPRLMTAEPAPLPAVRPPEAAPRQAMPQPPLPPPVLQGPPAPPRSAPLPLPPKAAPVPVVADSGSVNRCPDCGQPAGDLDMICIECGGFIG